MPEAAQAFTATHPRVSSGAHITEEQESRLARLRGVVSFVNGLAAGRRDALDPDGFGDLLWLIEDELAAISPPDRRVVRFPDASVQAA